MATHGLHVPPKLLIALIFGAIIGVILYAGYMH
jgi:hypothetical protein